MGRFAAADQRGISRRHLHIQPARQAGFGGHALGHWSYLVYNGLQQLIGSTNANGTVTRLGWCGCGSLETLTNAWNTPAQMITSFDYDLQGNRTFISYPDATVTNSFDALGRLSMTADGQGYRLFLYNNQGLVTNISNGLGTGKRKRVAH